MAEDYYAAMSVIEKRLESHLTSIITDKVAMTQSIENSKQNLLQLLNQLEITALNDKQLALISKLRHELLILQTNQNMFVG